MKSFPVLVMVVGAAFLGVVILSSLPCSTALTQGEIDQFDGAILVGNRADGGKIQIFPSNESSWNKRNVLWEYDTRKNKDGLTMTFDHINDVKRVRHKGREYILIAGNGPGLALMDLHTEQFVFSYKPQIPSGSRCKMSALSIHAGEFLPDGNFAVADPTGGDKGGPSVRLIYGSVDEPQILQSLPFAGVHGIVWDNKRQRLWAFGGSKLKQYRYISARKDSQLVQDGESYKMPDWMDIGHDMMPYGKDALIFTCAQGVGVFYIIEERFELLYGNSVFATNILTDTKIQRGKGVDYNPDTGEIITNGFETNVLRSPTTLVSPTAMKERAYKPVDDMKMYKAHFFRHNEFSYGAADDTPFLVKTIGRMNRRPAFKEGMRTKAIVDSGEFYKRNIRKHSIDPDGDNPIYEKLCGPDWLEIGKDGEIIGLPNEEDAGQEYQPMIIQVSDKGGLFDWAEYQFRVKAPAGSSLQSKTDSSTTRKTPAPTTRPSAKPTSTSKSPTDSPTTPYLPTEEPTYFPTEEPPTHAPTTEPTETQMPTAPPEPTQHPTTAFFAQRSTDREELTYFGPNEIGPNWKRSGLGQFGKCAGDCDRDKDCMPDLVCFQRSGTENNVPGCSGSAIEDVDYCYSPFDGSTQLEFNGSNGPHGLCTGDCDADSDCNPGLICYQRDGTQDKPPGCEGIPRRNTDYCIVDPKLKISPRDKSENDWASIIHFQDGSLAKLPVFNAEHPALKPTKMPTVPVATASAWEGIIATVTKRGRKGDKENNDQNEAIFGAIEHTTSEPTSSPTYAFQMLWRMKIDQYEKTNQVESKDKDQG